MYTPVIVTTENFQTAINQNVMLILQEVNKKLREEDTRPRLAGLDLGTNLVSNLATPTTAGSAATVANLTEVTP